MSWKIASVHGKDFCCFEDVFFDLSEQGLCYVNGINKSTAAAESNGAGKSNLFKMLTWGLWGKTIDGDEGDGVVRHGTKLARVEVALNDVSGVAAWTVVRERKKGSPRLSLVDAEGRPWEGSKDEIQEKIVLLVGHDFETFRNTSLYGQNDTLRFADPRTKDADRKNVLHRVLGSSVFGECHDWVKVRAKEERDALAVLTARRNTLEAELTGGASIELVQASSNRWEEERVVEVEACKGEAQKWKDVATAARASAVDITDVEARLKWLESAGADPDDAAALEKAQEQVELLRSASSSKMVAVKTYEVSESASREALAQLEGGECPVCTAPLTSGHAAEHKASLEKTAAVAKREMEKASKELENVLAILHAAKTDVVTKQAAVGLRAEARRKEAAELRVQVEEAESTDEVVMVAVGKARTALERVRALTKNKNPYLELLATATAKADACKTEMTAVAAKAAVLEEEQAYTQFWVKGFGGQGLPSYLLDSVMPYLTERSNHYLETLADGDITMNFSTQRALKSSKDEVRDEISITWEIGGRAGYAPSGGQLKKMQIATDLALMDLVSTRTGEADILLFDEVLDGLDAEGRARVLQLLQELRSKRSSIFVISHEADMAEIFERALTVVMDENGVSTLILTGAA